MRFTFWSKSGEYLGSAESRESYSGGGFIDSVEVLFKYLCIAMGCGALIYLPLVFCTDSYGINFGFVSGSSVEAGEFVARASICGAFAFSSFFWNSRRKMLIIPSIIIILLEFLYTFSIESFPMLTPILKLLTYAVTGIFTALGAPALYVAEYALGSIQSIGALWCVGLIGGLLYATIFLAIFYREPSWWGIWD